MAFTVFKGSSADGSPLFGFFDEKYTSFDDKKSYPWVLQLDIVANDLAQNRLPTGAANIVLNDFEDSIGEILSHSTPIIFFGHVTGDGGRVAYFYLLSPTPSYEILTKLCAGNPMRQMQFEIEHDPEWDRIAHMASSHRK